MCSFQAKMGNNKTGSDGQKITGSKATNGQREWKKIKKVSECVTVLKPAPRAPQTPTPRTKRSASLATETSAIVHAQRLKRNSMVSFLGHTGLIATIKSEESNDVTHADESHVTRGGDHTTIVETQDFHKHKKGPRLKNKRLSLAAIYTQQVCD